MSDPEQASDTSPLVQAIADFLHVERGQSGHHDPYHSCPCEIQAKRIATLFEEVDSMEVFTASDGHPAIRPTPGPLYRMARAGSGPSRGGR